MGDQKIDARKTSVDDGDRDLYFDPNRWINGVIYVLVSQGLSHTTGWNNLHVGFFAKCGLTWTIVIRRPMETATTLTMNTPARRSLRVSLKCSFQSMGKGKSRTRISIMRSGVPKPSHKLLVSMQVPGRSGIQFFFDRRTCEKDDEDSTDRPCDIQSMHYPERISEARGTLAENPSVEKQSGRSCY